MKNVLLGLVLFCICTVGYSQEYCKPLLDSAQIAYDANRLEDAFMLLRATETCDFKNTLQKDRQELQDKIFQAIQDQRNVAIAARNRAEKFTNFFFSNAREQVAWALGDNGKFGVVNRQGQLLSNGFVWEEPQQFEKNTAIARRFGDYFVVNTEGKAISEGFDWIHSTSMPYPFCIQRTGSRYYWDRYEKRFLSKKEGLIIAEMEPQLWHPGENKDTTALFGMPKGDKWGVLSYDGKEILPFDYETAHFDPKGRRLIVRKDGKKLLYSSTGKRIGTEKYDELRAFEDGRARFKKGDLWGFIDVDGNVIVPAIYDHADYFVDSLARVGKNDQWGIIDHRGKLLIDTTFDYVEVFTKTKFWVEKKEKSGLLNAQQEWIIEPVFDKVFYAEDGGGPVAFVEKGEEKFIVNEDGELLDNKFHITGIRIKGRDSDGIVMASIEGGGGRISRREEVYGLINAKGEWIVEPQLSEAKDFSNGKAWVEKEKKWGLINLKGEWLIEPLFNSLKEYNKEMAWVQEGKLWGLIGLNGNWVIPPSFNRISDFKEGIGLVRTKGQWQVLNIEHDLQLIDINIRAIRDFSDGLAPVLTQKGWTYIDSTGRLVLQSQFDRVFRSTKDSTIWMVEDNKLGMMDSLGNILLSPQLSTSKYNNNYNTSYDFKDSIAIVKKQDKWGIIDRQGNWLIKPEFEAIRSYSKGLALAKSRGEWGVVEKGGHWRVEPQFDTTSTITDDGVFFVKFSATNASWNGSSFFYPNGIYKNDLPKPKVDTTPRLWRLMDIMSNSLFQAPFKSVRAFSEGVAWVEKDSTWGLINTQGNWVLQPQWDAPRWGGYKFEDGVMKVRKANLWGLVNDKGKILLEPQFLDIKAIVAENLAWCKKDTLWGLFSLQGDQLIAPQFKDVREIPDKKLSWCRKAKLWGILDRAGNWLVEPSLEHFQSFSEEVCWVKKDTLWGLINEKGNWLIEPAFKDRRPFKDGTAWVKQNSNWGIIDKQGEWLLEPQFEWFNSYNNKGIGVRQGKKWGLLNKQGEWLVKPRFESLEKYSDQFYKVKLDDKWGLVDTNGVMVLSPAFKKIATFNEHLTWLLKEDRWDLIQLKGKKVLTTQIDEHKESNPFENSSFSRSSSTVKGFEWLKKDNKWGMVNKEGSFLLPIEFDTILYRGPDRFLLQQGNQKGFVQFKEEVSRESDAAPVYQKYRFIPCEYEQIGIWTSEKAAYWPVRQNGKWGFIHWEPQGDMEVGVLRIPCRYDAVTPFMEINGKRVARAYIEEFDLDFYINEKGEMMVELESIIPKNW